MSLVTGSIDKENQPDLLNKLNMNAEATTQKCSNCDKEIESAKFLLHEAFCFRNLIRCSCGEMVSKTDRELHMEEMHQIIKCPNCNKEGEKYLMDKHIAECDRKPIFCEFCELNIPIDEFPAHQEYCGSRSEKCVYCGMNVPMKDMDNHRISGCPYSTSFMNDAPQVESSNSGGQGNSKNSSSADVSRAFDGTEIISSRPAGRRDGSKRLKKEKSKTSRSSTVLSSSSSITNANESAAVPVADSTMMSDMMLAQMLQEEENARHAGGGDLSGAGVPSGFDQSQESFEAYKVDKLIETPASGRRGVRKNYEILDDEGNCLQGEEEQEGSEDEEYVDERVAPRRRTGTVRTRSHIRIESSDEDMQDIQDDDDDETDLGSFIVDEDDDDAEVIDLKDEEEDWRPGRKSRTSGLTRQSSRKGKSKKSPKKVKPSRTRSGRSLRSSSLRTEEEEEEQRPRRRVKAKRSYVEVEDDDEDKDEAEEVQEEYGRHSRSRKSGGFGRLRGKSATATTVGARKHKTVVIDDDDDEEEEDRHQISRQHKSNDAIPIDLNDGGDDDLLAAALARSKTEF